MSGCIFATKAFIDNRKNLVKRQYLYHMSQNMANVGPLTAEIDSGVWGTPANFNRFHVLPSLYCSEVAHRKPTKLCTMFSRLLGCYIVYTFLGGSCSLMEFCQVQNSLCVQVLRSPILAALLHGTPAKLCRVVQEIDLRNFRCRGRHLYSLDIGPHSSLLLSSRAFVFGEQEV